MRSPRAAPARPGVGRSLLWLGAAAALGSLTRLRPVSAADDRARHAIAGLRSPAMDRGLPILTDLGSMWAVLGLTAGLRALGRRRLARDAFGAGATAWTVAQLTKPLYDRPRPYEDASGGGAAGVGGNPVRVLVERPAGRSYPSGHPAVAAAVAGVFAARLRGPARPLVRALPGLVAYSRVYVGVHYPVDVAGGVLLGAAVGALWQRIGSRRQARRLPSLAQGAGRRRRFARPGSATA